MSEWKDTEIGQIPLDWEIIKASSYCVKVTDGTHDSPKQKEKGFPLVTSKHIKGESINFDDAYLISKEDYEKINQRSKVDQWDVIISMIGEYCGFSYIEENETINYAIKNVGLFKPNDELDSKWLFYYLQGRNAKHYIGYSRTGTSQPYLTLGALRDFPIIVPTEKKEKESIVKTLDALRYKITLLRQQNQDLEELAQTLFKRWFVEFEFPNENGEPYKSSCSKMVESELGEIPEGWRVKTVKDFITKYNTGADAIQKAPMVDEDTGVRCIRIGDLSNSRDFNQWGFTKITPENFKQFRLLKNDIIITRTSLLGLSYLIIEDLDAVFNNGSIRIRPKNGYAIYLYSYLRSQDFNNHISKITNETSTRPNMKMDYLLIYNVLDIPNEILEKYTGIAESLIFKQYENIKEIQTLTQLRNTLLPKLMSGELRVKM
ncbi:restriction endonuclease subunit S [Plebeiibacterium sediminum]|uniref:Restriction endonuclease subunit S n=1 Tax=Plebeiibacterium sediminum TaxID=2992112 RepID=A0AAE3SH78_9BACT|nr:restriction endonuclease subunit S [Plebeiobacterium sediminum]MCW3789285.1 restriction endonuclease subunit S [Plebeiobacterium sediminum]